jgi:choline dehydrogenase-like flavoprotein
VAGAGSAGCVLPSFKRMEDWEDGASELRGAGGPVKVTRQKDLTPAFRPTRNPALGFPPHPQPRPRFHDREQFWSLFGPKCSRS